MTEYDGILTRAELSQVIDYIKNGETCNIDTVLDHEQDSFHALNKLEDAINSKLNPDDAASLIEEINNCMFRIENISFQNGARAGAKLLKELLQI